MKILIIRHAEPDYSKDSLTEKGFKEAECLAERLMNIHIDEIYCSPMGRAKATIEPYIDKIGKEMRICPWLHEFEGKKICDDGAEAIPWDQMPDVISDIKGKLSYENWTQFEPYSTGNVRERYNYVISEFETLMGEYGYIRKNGMYIAKNNEKKTIAFICHFGLGAMLASHIANIPAPLMWQGFFLAPSSVTSFVTEERKKGIVSFRCEYMGDISHLYRFDEKMSHSGLYHEVYNEAAITGAQV